MTNYVWKNGISGDWSIAGDWSPNGTPSLATDAVQISTAGTYTVTIAANQSYSVGSITLDTADVDVQVEAGFVGPSCCAGSGGPTDRSPPAEPPGRCRLR